MENDWFPKKDGDRATTIIESRKKKKVL